MKNDNELNQHCRFSFLIIHYCIVTVSGVRTFAA